LEGAALDALMTILPVIVRELRASARQPFTYFLRLLGVVALLLASAWFGLYAGFEPGLGRQLFSALHRTLLGAIWVLVPMLTADCISRERREGTLGLLFLTPLKGTDIVVAKSLAHGLRAFTLWLAVLPVLTIPFLVGGVSWTEAALSVVINANAMCWALAAGLLASAWSKAWRRALLLATLLACVSFLLFQAAAGWFLLQALNAGRPRPLDMDPDHALSAGFALVTNIRGQVWFGSSGWGGVGLIARVLGQTTVLSVFVLAAAVVAAGARIRRSWREEPPSVGRVWLQRIFCTPVLWTSFLHKWMRWKLERNPIGWLEQRTWSGRLVTWSWFAVLVSIYSAVLTGRNSFQEDSGVHELIACLLAGSIAVTAAGSFRRERDSGVLELLLVSPLGESQIISGRLRGLWGQFLPVTGLLLAVWLFYLTLLPYESSGDVLLFYAASFLSLPVFGLYYSLRCRNFLAALLLTVAVGVLLPLALAQGIHVVQWAYAAPATPFALDLRVSAAAAVCQALLAMYYSRQLYRRLKQRAFPLERGSGE
jgi:ABC-type transport system involved in multi-copper enzyme maturation permease subunit